MIVEPSEVEIDLACLLVEAQSDAANAGQVITKLQAYVETLEAQLDYLSVRLKNVTTLSVAPDDL
jgi:uncharacterized coiled-coil protein SlyX